MEREGTNGISSRWGANSIPTLRCSVRAEKFSRTECRDFFADWLRGVRFGGFEDANERTGGFCCCGGAPLQTRRGPYCWCWLFQRRQYRRKHAITSAGNYARCDSISARWCRWFRTKCLSYHLCTFGSALVIRIPSFQHPRLNVLSNFFAAPAPR